MNKAQLIEKAKAKGWLYEEHHGVCINNIGVSMLHGVWYWFWIFDEGEESESLYFKEAYSQNNGKTYQDRSHRLTAWRMLGVFDNL